MSLKIACFIDVLKVTAKRGSQGRVPRGFGARLGHRAVLAKIGQDL